MIFNTPSFIGLGITRFIGLYSYEINRLSLLSKLSLLNCWLICLANDTQISFSWGSRSWVYVYSNFTVLKKLRAELDG